MMLFCFLMNGLSCFRQDSAPGRAELLSSASSLSFTISRSWQWQASDTKGAGKTRWHVCMSSIDSISPQPYKSSKYCLVIKRTGHIQNKNNISPTNCLLSINIREDTSTESTSSNILPTKYQQSEMHCKPTLCLGSQRKLSMSSCRSCFSWAFSCRKSSVLGKV